MSEFEGYKIKLEKSDEKGMLNALAIRNYINKAEKAICEISLNKGFGSGFFCKIPYTQNNNILLPVLITNNHVLPKDKLKDYIEIKINGQTKIISLKQRKIWTDEEMDFTCIEIKEEDKISNFYILDDNVLDENYSDYLNQNVLIFAINKNDKQIGFSNGIIKKNKDAFFAYNCNTYPGCSGGCVVNQFNNNAIGIHRGEIETEDKKVLNIGIYISKVINYIKNYKENISQNIKITTSKTSTILLLGEPGNGKSTLGNKILGYQAFTTFESLEIITKEFSLRKGGEKNNLFVIDSPPIEDSLYNNAQFSSRLVKFIEEHNELNAIIFVLNYYNVRFPRNLQTILKFLFKIFKNKNLENHIALIFTNSFTKRGEPTPEDKCKKLDKIISQLKRVIEEETGVKSFNFPSGFINNEPDPDEGNYSYGKMDLERIIAWASSLDNLIFKIK